jgi:hypothetical protein
LNFGPILRFFGTAMALYYAKHLPGGLGGGQDYLCGDAGKWRRPRVDLVSSGRTGPVAAVMGP